MLSVCILSHIVRNAVSSCLLLIFLNGSLSKSLWIFHKLWKLFLALNWQLCDTQGCAPNSNICVWFACCVLVVLPSSRESLSFISAGGSCKFSLQELFCMHTHTYSRTPHTSGPFQSLLSFHCRHHQVLQMWTLPHRTENNGSPVLCLDLMTSYRCCGGTWEPWNRLYYVKHIVMV